MKKLILLTVALLGVTATTTPAHADIFDNVKNNTSPAAKHPSPWETDKNGNDITAPVVDGYKIPYYVSPNDPYATKIDNAADGWNELGVVKLVRVNNESDSDFTFEENSETFGKYVTAATSLGYDPNGNYVHAKIDINTVNFDKLDSDLQIATLQHEMGHGLGFAHNDYLGYNHYIGEKAGLIMRSNINYHTLGDPTLGAIEQKALIQHYHLPVRPLTKAEQIAEGVDSSTTTRDAPADQ